MMKYIQLLLIALVTISLLTSASLKKTKFNLSKKAPPGTVKLLNNFYCDKTEIRNVDYREYLFWAAKQFGEKSDNYKACLPDTNIWSINADSLSRYYLRHPLYSYYPVVGISQKQAINFSKWRSDRVFYFLLVSKGIIKSNTQSATESTDCTIENI